MCCLFGVLDTQKVLTRMEINYLIASLGKAAEARGTDVTGISYIKDSRMVVYKKPVAAHKIHFRIPKGTHAVMGHTRLTTQGSAKDNYNNHPFRASCNHEYFSLAHNGVLFNDDSLKTQYHLSPTNIKTDSYVIAQLLEQQPELSMESIKKVTEALKGNFTYTILDSSNGVYFVKGNNPLCIFYYPFLGIYAYASTKEILGQAIQKTFLIRYKPKEIQMDEGEIVYISQEGQITRGGFDVTNLYYGRFFHFLDYGFDYRRAAPNTVEQDYLDEVCAFAMMNGIPDWKLNLLTSHGVSASELEDYIYEPELLDMAIDEILCDYEPETLSMYL